MTKDQKIGVMWKLLFGTVTCLFFALPALSDSSKLTKTSCQGEFSKQSTLPTSYKCNMVRLPDGTMLQTVPKLFSPPAVVAGKFPGKHIICRIPDCGKNLCKNGWCEETMVGYNCTCSSGFQGRHCDEQSTKDATTKPMMSYTKTMTERSDTTTFQSTTTSAKTKSATSPTATMPEQSDATTSQENITSKSVESSTTDVATKTATRPMTTVSASTTSPETTASNSTGLSTADATNKTTMSPTTTMSDTTTSQDTTTSKSTKEATTKPTTSSTTTMTERSDTTTSQSTATSEWVQTEAKTKSATSPTATMPGRSDPTTSQETTTSKSVESSTTDATTKPMTSPTTAMSDTTTSQETTITHIKTCSSPPVDCEFGGSFYNFSTAMMNQASAVSACSQYGSHLVFIESEEEEDFIARSVQYLSDQNTNDYWFGLTGSSLSEARWLDGSSLTYSNFNQYSFNDHVNCFLIRCEDQYSRWHDYYCSTQLRFICEKEVGI